MENKAGDLNVMSRICGMFILLFVIMINGTSFELAYSQLLMGFLPNFSSF